MTGAADLIDRAPLQDRDLLLRLSLYFDAFDQRLRQGQGWFIFNAEGGRGSRIASFIQRRIDEYGGDTSSFVMGWRDFALSAYVTEVGLPQLEPEVRMPGASERLAQEFAFAKQLTDDVWDRCLTAEMLVLIGLKPRLRHEAACLEKAIEGRYQQRLATIILTPEMPQQLEAELHEIDPTDGCWDRIFSRMYETSLVAL